MYCYDDSRTELAEIIKYENYRMCDDGTYMWCKTTYYDANMKILNIQISSNQSYFLISQTQPIIMIFKAENLNLTQYINNDHHNGELINQTTYDASRNIIADTDEE